MQRLKQIKLYSPNYFGNHFKGGAKTVLAQVRFGEVCLKNKIIPKSHAPQKPKKNPQTQTIQTSEIYYQLFL